MSQSSKEKRTLVSTALSLLLGAILLNSCAHPSVVEQSKPVYGSLLSGHFLNAKRLTSETRSYLQEQKLELAYRRQPDEVISSLAKKISRSNSVKGRLALIELCFDTGEKQKKIEDGLGYFLTASDLAYTGVFRKGVISANDQIKLRDRYNYSCGKVVQFFSDSSHPWNQSIEVEGPVKSYRVSCRKSGKGIVTPDFFDTLIPAEYLKFKDIKLERIIREGFGSSLVGRRNYSLEHLKDTPLLPPSGMSLPLNATLEFSRGKEVSLCFRDLMLEDRIHLGGKNVPLAADLTAPLASMYDYIPKHNIGLDGLRHPERYKDKSGIFQIEPFRKDRIPVILVHGLMSSPETWVTALNQLRADPLLRKKYQVLVFYYPTGFPIAFCSASLRHSLKGFRMKVDPNHRNPHMDNMMLIGHSLGGLLSSAQVRTSGETYTNLLFNRPINQLEGLDSKQKDLLHELLKYNPNPDISRVVFVAAPHRGSNLAAGSLGQIGANLIKMPKELLSIEPIPDIPDMTPIGREIIMSRPDSITDLEPNAPGLLATLKQPVRRGVTLHSIIGNHKMKSPLSETGDTVVPYWSAHLNDTASEKVVDAIHTTICENADAIEEMRRILYLHAKIPYRAKSTQ